MIEGAMIVGLGGYLNRGHLKSKNFGKFAAWTAPWGAAALAYNFVLADYTRPYIYQGLDVVKSFFVSNSPAASMDFGSALAYNLGNNLLPMGVGLFVGLYVAMEGLHFMGDISSNGRKLFKKEEKEHEQYYQKRRMTMLESNGLKAAVFATSALTFVGTVAFNFFVTDKSYNPFAFAGLAISYAALSYMRAMVCPDKAGDGMFIGAVDNMLGHFVHGSETENFFKKTYTSGVTASKKGVEYAKTGVAEAKKFAGEIYTDGKQVLGDAMVALTKPETYKNAAISVKDGAKAALDGIISGAKDLGEVMTSLVTGK